MKPRAYAKLFTVYKVQVMVTATHHFLHSNNDLKMVPVVHDLFCFFKHLQSI